MNAQAERPQSPITRESQLAKPLRILVVDEDERRGAALSEVLRISGYEVVRQIDASAFLPEVVADADPDIVLIDIASPGRDTLEQLGNVNRTTPRPVVMFSKDEDQAAITESIRAGVSAYIVDGLASTKVTPVFHMAIAQFQMHQSMRQELTQTKATLDERKYIDRAKGILMESGCPSESDAFASLRKEAMVRRTTIGVIAREIVGAQKEVDR